jgi:ketosteroid isomerase-like protein
VTGATERAETTARAILTELQACFADSDVDRFGRLMDDECVLFGTIAANLDRDQTMAYVGPLVEQQATIRWGWDTVVPLVSEPDLLCFAVVGSVGLDDGGRSVFRLTCVAERNQGRWRLRHFHGSVPDVE